MLHHVASPYLVSPLVFWIDPRSRQNTNLGSTLVQPVSFPESRKNQHDYIYKVLYIPQFC